MMAVGFCKTPFHKNNKNNNIIIKVKLHKLVNYVKTRPHIWLIKIQLTIYFDNKIVRKPL